MHCRDRCRDSPTVSGSSARWRLRLSKGSEKARREVDSAWHSVSLEPFCFMVKTLRAQDLWQEISVRRASAGDVQSTGFSRLITRWVHSTFNGFVISRLKPVL